MSSATRFLHANGVPCKQTRACASEHTPARAHAPYLRRARSCCWGWRCIPAAARAALHWCCCRRRRACRRTVRAMRQACGASRLEACGQQPVEHSEVGGQGGAHACDLILMALACSKERRVPCCAVSVWRGVQRLRPCRARVHQRSKQWTEDGFCMNLGGVAASASPCASPCRSCSRAGHAHTLCT